MALGILGIGDIGVRMQCVLCFFWGRLLGGESGRIWNGGTKGVSFFSWFVFSFEEGGGTY